MESQSHRCFSLVMAKNMYGRLLLKDPARQKQAAVHLR